MAYAGNEINASSSRAPKRLNIVKVNHKGKQLSDDKVARGGGTELLLIGDEIGKVGGLYNPESMRYGKRITNRENSATGEYNPPVELLGGNATTLAFNVRLNAYGEAPAYGNNVEDAAYEKANVEDISDIPLFKNYSDLPANAPLATREGMRISQGLYRRLLFLESLQYPNPVSVGRYMKTPLIKIIVGSHLPLIWTLNNIEFDIKQFDGNLNVLRVDCKVDFKLADCYYNAYMFGTPGKRAGTVEKAGYTPSMFYNLGPYGEFGDITDEEVTNLIRKHQEIAKKITGD